MQCLSDEDCPLLYNCNNGSCSHQPLTDICPQILICVFLVPFFVGLSNRIGLSTIWILYPALITLMAYQYAQSLSLITPISLAASFVMLFLALKEKSQTGSGPAVNFYVVNAAIPSLTIAANFGLFLSKVLPFLYICAIGIITSIIFLFLAYKLLKDIEANQKINVGHFRKMLPSRLQNSKKINLTIQLALIQQADSEIEQNENQISPTRKTRIRKQLIQQFQNGIPSNQLLVCVLCFLCYECLTLSLPEVIEWLGVRQGLAKFGITYGILFAAVVIGQIYLYKLYIQPKRMKEEQNKVNLGVKMDGQKMVKLSAISFLGGFLEGFIGFGFSFVLFFYLVHTDISFKDIIATCGFFTIFISISFTLSSIFCGNFNWLHYLIIFLLTLLVVIAFQYLFNSYLESNINPSSLNSTLITLISIVLISNLLSILLSFSLSWLRFGFDSINKFGTFDNC